MPGVALTPAQEELKRELVELLNRLLNWTQASQDEVEEWLEELADKAFELHSQLKSEGQEPRYAAITLAKRGMPPNKREFY